jgi:hypothetical protein
MRISEKIIRRGGRTLRVIELVPVRVEKTLRLMCGAAGVLFILLAIGLALFIPQFSERYQFKVIILGLAIGGTMILAALGRRVYRSVDRMSVRSGTRWLGVTRWSPAIPTTKSQVVDIGRNEDSELFISVRRPEGQVLLSIGPFVDGDQAVKASSLLSPGQVKEVEGSAQVDALQIIQQLEGGLPLIASRALMLSVFFLLLVPAWFDHTWLDVILSMTFALPLLILAVGWLAPAGGVFYNTDDSESVEFWRRHRFFGRLEYRKSLVANEPPLFIRRKFHWASVGWLILIPIYVATMVALVLR